MARIGFTVLDPSDEVFYAGFDGQRRERVAVKVMGG
jgi:hypothetical protein